MKSLIILVTLLALSAAQIVFPDSRTSPQSSGSSHPSFGSSRPTNIGGGGGNTRNNDVDSQLFAALSQSNRGLSPGNRGRLQSLLGKTVLQGSSCRLPEGNIGTCGRLSQCQSYAPQFANIFGLLDFFVARVCSYTTRSVMVCCPQSNINRPQPRPATRPTLVNRPQARPATRPTLVNRPQPRPATRPTRRPTPRPTPGAIVPNSLFPSVCGNSAANRVIGGTEVQPGAYPWLVALGRPGLGRFAVICGGSLITRRHVITAAHCFDHIIPSHARVGEHNVNTNNDGASPENVRIANRQIHSSYSRSLSENDIAVVKLERDVSFNERVQPVCLPFRNDLKNNNFLNTNLDVVGWGTTSERTRQTSPVPREAKVRVNSLSSCQRAYSDVQNIRLTEQQLCAGGDGTDSCQGDSGGPLNYLDIREDRYYLAGVTSTGVGCGRKDFPGVYARVGAYLDWIVSNVQ